MARSGETLTKFENVNDILKLDEPLCRICRDNYIENLIQPCNCKGSIAYIHKECLDAWVKTSKMRICELCSTEYNIDVEFDESFSDESFSDEFEGNLSGFGDILVDLISTPEFWGEQLKLLFCILVSCYISGFGANIFLIVISMFIVDLFVFFLILVAYYFYSIMYT